MYLALIVCIGLLTILTIILWIEIKRTRKDRKSLIDSNHYLAELPNPQIQQKLLAMVGGDRHIVQRLITNVKRKYPHQTELWYWEKAIEDLERDRR